MSKRIEKALYIFFLSICLSAFQNCTLKQSDKSLELSGSGDQTSQGVVTTPPPINGDSLEAKAVTLLQNKCYSCHGTSDAGGVSQINNPTYLISIGQIIPGNPDGSPLYRAVRSGSMPLGGVQPLTTDELNLLNSWILAGAKSPGEGDVNPPIVIPLAGNYKSILANILTPKCIHCHSGSNAKDGIRLDTYTSVKQYISGKNPQNSKLYEVSASGEMPPRPDSDLTSEELKALSDWIISGSPNN